MPKIVAVEVVEVLAGAAVKTGVEEEAEEDLMTIMNDVAMTMAATVGAMLALKMITIEGEVIPIDTMMTLTVAAHHLVGVLLHTHHLLQQ
jgi:hypothetical protein